MSEEILFGDKTPGEIEKFEKDTKGIIILNGFGENALSLQRTDTAEIIMYVDKISLAKNTKYPNLFYFSPREILKTYNFLNEIIEENPDLFKK